MHGSRIVSEFEFAVESLPFGVVLVDREATIKAYKPFTDAGRSPAHERLIGTNFFGEVGHPQIRRFHDRFASFASSRQTRVEPFEFSSSLASGARRVSILFVRDADVAERISIIIMRDGGLA